MRAELASDGANDDGILRQLFMNRLSPVTRAALAILPDNESLEKVATAADRFQQAKRDVEGPSLAALTPPPPPESASGEIASLTASFATLTATVARLEASLQTRHKDAHSPDCQPELLPHRRRQGRDKPICFYHSRFGPAARKCAPPCVFSQQPENSQA